VSGGTGNKKEGRRDPALSALAVPTASEAATATEAAAVEAAAVEAAAVEAAAVEATAVEAAAVEAPEPSDRGRAHTMRKTATPEMTDMRDTSAAAIHVAQAAHAMAKAMIEAAVVGVATKYGGVAVVAAVPITLVIRT